MESNQEATAADKGAMVITRGSVPAAVDVHTDSTRADLAEIDESGQEARRFQLAAEKAAFHLREAALAASVAEVATRTQQQILREQQEVARLLSAAPLGGDQAGGVVFRADDADLRRSLSYRRNH